MLNVPGRQAFFFIGLIPTPNFLDFFINSRSSQSIRASLGRSFGNRLTCFLIAEHRFTLSSSIQTNGYYHASGGAASVRHRTIDPHASGLILATESIAVAIDLSRVCDAPDIILPCPANERLQLAQKPEENLAFLNEFQRIVRESKRTLVDTDSKKC